MRFLKLIIIYIYIYIYFFFLGGGKSYVAFIARILNMPALQKSLCVTVCVCVCVLGGGGGGGGLGTPARTVFSCADSVKIHSQITFDIAEVKVVIMTFYCLGFSVKKSPLAKCWLNLKLSPGERNSAHPTPPPPPLHTHTNVISLITSCCIKVICQL